jgi:hypothetical protein
LGVFILNATTRWVYQDTRDLICVHVAASDNTTTALTDSQQIEYRFENSAGTEFKWHRPAEVGSQLTGKATFPREITTQDPSRMSQVKIYLNYPPKTADRDGVTHVICDMKANRDIKGVQLIYGFLIQMNENGGPAYGNNQELQWDVYKETINLTAGTQRYPRQIPGEHIRKQADAQMFMPRHTPFFYWRMEGPNTFRPGDEIEFSFRFVSQPFAKARVGVRS